MLVVLCDQHITLNLKQTNIYSGGGGGRKCSLGMETTRWQGSCWLHSPSFPRNSKLASSTFWLRKAAAWKSTRSESTCIYIFPHAKLTCCISPHLATTRVTKGNVWGSQRSCRNSKSTTNESKSFLVKQAVREVECLCQKECFTCLVACLLRKWLDKVASKIDF